MSCKSCGREPENSVSTHWLGCEETWKTVQRGNLTVSTNADVCERGDCMHPKRPQGKGPKPKYCGDHSDPKSRKA